jgi:general secretion pathway protein D
MNPRRPLPPCLPPVRLLVQLLALALSAGAAQAQPAAPATSVQADKKTDKKTSKQSQASGDNLVSLNFVNAELEAVVRAIGQFTGKTFIVDPRVKATVNLVTEKPVTRDEAYRILLSTLRLHGAAVVEADGIAKVVTEADAKLQGAAAAPVPGRPATRGDQIVTQVFRLNYESATSLVPVLRPLIAPNNTINAYPSNNTLVVTDYAENIQRIGRIIAAIDTAAGSDLEVFPVKNGVASDLAAILSRLMESGPGGGPGDAGQRITILADPRTNSILIRSASPARTSLARSLIAKLDRPSADSGNVHIVYLKNADAQRLAQTLRSVLSGDTSNAAASSSSSGFSQNNANSNAANATNPAATGTQPNAGGSGGAFGGSNNASQLNAPTGGGMVQADPATNTLIITAPEPVYRNLRAIIDQLDVRRAQVIIESLIVEVTADKAAEFGVQWLGLSGNDQSKYRIGGASTFGSGGSNLAAVVAGGGQVLPGNGINVGIFKQVNGNLTLGALARALESDANANILSVPNIITLDNEEGKIVVGQNVPFITGQFTSTGSGSSNGTVNPFQTIERRDVGLTLRVKPTVSDSGTVKMAIFQEVSSVQDTTNNSGIITNKRSIESIVQVDDGQVIVLGGLVQDSVRDTVEKVPGLGNVPVLGNLFRYDNRKRSKTNLMVFLRPYIVRDAESANGLVLDRYDYMRRLQSDAQPPAHWALPNMNAPILPPIGDTRTGAAAVGAPKPIPPHELGTLMSAQDTVVLQAAQFADMAQATAAEQQIAAKGYRVSTEIATEAGAPVYRVRVAVNRDARSVDQAMAGLKDLGFTPQAVPSAATK